MKNCFLLICFLALHLCSYGQSLPVPEVKNKVMWVRQSKKLVDLEKTDLHTSYSATRLTGKANYAIVADGEKSIVIRSGNPADVFIVRLDAGADPEKAVELLKFEEGKDQRVLPLGEKTLGKLHSEEPDKPTLVFKQIESGVYTISVENQLEIGEYCFMVNRPKIKMESLSSGKVQTFTGYCFSVGN